MRRVLAFTACSLLLALTVQAQDRVQEGERSPDDAFIQQRMKDPRGFRSLRMPGDRVEKNVEKLTKKLHWYKSLSSALTAARRQGKPVVFIQALGDLDGFL